MKLNEQFQNYLLYAGGIMLLGGAVLWMPKVSFAPYLFTLGALIFAIVQYLQKVNSSSIVLKRLRSQQLAGAFFLVLTGALMIASTFHVPYTQRNEWMVAFAIGTIFELYTAFRIPVEIDKEKRK